MSPSPKVLIAGAGWRVSAIVVPALLALGLRQDDIHIIRRQAIDLAGTLAGIRLLEWKELDSSYDLTVNCVVRDALVAVQARVVARFPRAIHFCDTPIFERVRELPRLRTLSKGHRLFSLEDWPFMPNLTPMFARCTTESRLDHILRFEHVGIPTHFFSAVRTAQRLVRRTSPGTVFRRDGEWTVRHAGSPLTGVLAGTKDFARSKISMWNGESLIEDFFDVREVVPGGAGSVPEAPEVISREIAGDSLRYVLDGVVYREVGLSPAIRAAVLSSPNRKAVHELDKCIALMDIFGGALDGGATAYRLYDSVRDTLAARLIGKLEFGFL